MLTPTPQPDVSAAAMIDWYLCLMVDEDNDMALPTGDFTAEVEYAALANALGRDDQTVTIGSIGRNGTTVHIPYLTTYEGYNQRIVLSNRGSADAAYTISFRPEADVTAMAKDAAMGTLMAGSTVTMKAMDLVELSGASRTAATINFVANSSDIDVTSVTVNMETRGYRHGGPSLDVRLQLTAVSLRQPHEKGGLRPSLFVVRRARPANSLEVQVLYPARWRRRTSEAQERRREAGPEGSVEQSRDPMDKNRIRGLPGRTSGHIIAKSIAIKGRGDRSSGCAVKAAGLTSGELRRVRKFRTERAGKDRHRGAEGSRVHTSPACRRRSERRTGLVGRYAHADQAAEHLGKV